MAEIEKLIEEIKIPGQTMFNAGVDTGSAAALAHTGKPTVKPLEWEAGDGISASTDYWQASDGFGGYYAVCDQQWWHLSGWGSEVDDWTTDDAAKAAAQADYEARIRSALQTGAET